MGYANDTYEENVQLTTRVGILERSVRKWKKRALEAEAKLPKAPSKRVMKRLSVLHDKIKPFFPTDTVDVTVERVAIVSRVFDQFPGWVEGAWEKRWDYLTLMIPGLPEDIRYNLLTPNEVKNGDYY